MTALLGTFVKLSTMADGTPRIVLDLQCKLADIAAMGLMPGVPFGLARITGESSVAPNEPIDEPKIELIRLGELCIMACTFCKDKRFWEWCGLYAGDTCRSEDEAKALILFVCKIDSRKHLDTDKFAATRFHTRIREPFMKWKSEQ